jgi:hypothetical protein
MQDQLDSRTKTELGGHSGLDRTKRRYGTGQSKETGRIIQAKRANGIIQNQEDWQD